MKIQTKTSALLLLLTSFGNSQASLVTVNGDTVSFTHESSLLGFFGIPTIDLQQLSFAQTTFVAKTIGEKGDYIRTSHVGTGGQMRAADLNAPSHEKTAHSTPTTPFVQQTSFSTPNSTTASTLRVISVSIRDNLVTLSNVFGDLGLVEKKAVISGISSVPLPARIWLFGVALLGFLGYAKRINYL